MLLPILIALVLTGVTTGFIVTALGYYAPFMIAGSICISIAAGLMTTFKPTTGQGSWIGYQILFGIGVGMGFQQSFLAVQTVLPQKDIPVGTTAVIFANNLGGAVFVSVANNLFTNELSKNLRQRVPALDPAIVLGAGATEWRGKVSAATLNEVLTVYNIAITRTFFVPTALGCAAVVAALFVEWRSVKGKGAKQEKDDSPSVESAECEKTGDSRADGTAI
jgi:MFS family permease